MSERHSSQYCTALCAKFGLEHIPSHLEEASRAKIENCIGFTRVPLGVAGPLTIKGKYQQKTGVYAPLATTESALVASCSRGAKAFELCGGVKATVFSDHMTRAPTLRFNTVDEAVRFSEEVPRLEPAFRADAESTSRYAKLKGLSCAIVGTHVHLTFDYSCGDTAGQNMATIATHKACQSFLTSPEAVRFGIIGYAVEGNMSSDKKLSWGNVHNGRGVEVLAWGTISNAVCEKVLGTKARTLHHAIGVSQEGSIRHGQVGYNINAANVVAAMFIACGQDAACVLESGWNQ